ncbi:unnamed protein product [Rotaria magnacalcarata]|uniref:Uncharacterized protein n=1 Tax=Rotaria magnacalcarata TaxID=392030 RepID=A0A815MX14_9BILA|nr:unnamed protein product [Rotaria magnacalcarata]CAF4072931.1 unnamed protein product [Rotaria magnacalcarata]
MVKTVGMSCKFLFILLCTLYIGPIAIRSQASAPPQWFLVWMTSASSFNLCNNQTTDAQIFYDWRQRSQVINLMLEDSYTYTIFNIENTVWRLERANRSCCIDPQQAAHGVKN